MSDRREDGPRKPHAVQQRAVGTGVDHECPARPCVQANLEVASRYPRSIDHKSALLINSGAFFTDEQLVEDRHRGFFATGVGDHEVGKRGVSPIGHSNKSRPLVPPRLRNVDGPSCGCGELCPVQLSIATHCLPVCRATTMVEIARMRPRHWSPEGLLRSWPGPKRNEMRCQATGVLLRTARRRRLHAPVTSSTSRIGHVCPGIDRGLFRLPWRSHPGTEEARRPNVVFSDGQWLRATSPIRVWWG